MFDTRKWSHQSTIVALCTLGFFSTMVARVVISPFVPDLTESLAASTGMIGLALTGMWAAYALTQFPSGVLADHHGERIVILVGIGATGAASLFIALSPSYPVFFVFAVVLGGAAGLVYSAATSLVTKQSEETGRAIGIYVAGGPLAGLLAPPIAVAFGSRFGWRVGIALGVVSAIPVLLLFAWTIESTAPARTDVTLREHLDVHMFVDLITRPTITYTTILAVLGAFTWQATASFLPAFLESFHGISQGMASILFSAYFVIHGATQPVTGILSDRFSRDGAALLTMATGIVGYSLLLVGSSFTAIVVAIGLIGLAMSWGAPLQTKFMDNLSETEQGTGFGFVRTVYMSLGSLGSVVTGFLVDISGWVVAFGLLVALMTISSLLLVLGLSTNRI